MLSPSPAAAHGAKHITCNQIHIHPHRYVSRVHTHTPTRTQACLPLVLLRYLRTDMNAVPMTTMTTVQTQTLSQSRSQTLGRAHTHRDTRRSADCSRQTSSSSGGDAVPLSSHLPLSPQLSQPLHLPTLSPFLPI